MNSDGPDFLFVFSGTIKASIVFATKFSTASEIRIAHCSREPL